ncbi:MAG: hypothetical protein QW371_04730 [Candidatus Bathyarchaeia archaeon]
MMKRLGMVLAIVLIFSSILSQASAQGNPEPLRIHREVIVANWGSVVIADRIEGEASALEAIEVGFPGSMASSMKEWRAIDSSGVEVAVREVAEAGARWLSARLPSGGGGSRSLTLYSAFDGLLSYGALKFYLRLNPFPMLKAPIENCTVQIFLPGDAKVSLGEGPIFSVSREGMALVLRASLAPLEPYLDKEFVIDFTSYEQRLLKVESLERSITFEESGDLIVKDSYSVRNLCQRSIDGVMVPLAKGAERVVAEDAGGALPQTIHRGPGDSLNVTVRPRFKNVRFSEGFSFTVSFRIPKEEAVKRGKGFESRGIELELIPPIPGFAEGASATISLPRGFSLRSAEPAPIRMREEAYASTLIYSLGSISPISKPRVRLEYSFNPFWSALKPLGWAFALEAILLGAVAVGISKRGARPKAGPLAELLKKFVDLYGEKNALRLNLKRMEEELLRGGIGKNEYKRRRKVAEERIKELERALAPVKDGLKKGDPRYAELIGGIERAEAEIEAAKASESQLRAQYRSGRISKEVYNSLLSASRKRGEKAEREIEAALISLRGEAK